MQMITQLGLPGLCLLMRYKWWI